MFQNSLCNPQQNRDFPHVKIDVTTSNLPCQVKFTIWCMLLNHAVFFLQSIKHTITLLVISLYVQYARFILISTETFQKRLEQKRIFLLGDVCSRQRCSCRFENNTPDSWLQISGNLKEQQLLTQLNLSWYNGGSYRSAYLTFLVNVVYVRELSRLESCVKWNPSGRY